MTTDNEYRLNIASLDAEQSNWSLIKRLLEFSWQFKAHCIQLICLQIVLLAIGLSGLGLTGLGIDYLRFETVTGREPATMAFWVGSAGAVEPNRGDARDRPQHRLPGPDSVVSKLHLYDLNGSAGERQDRRQLAIPGLRQAAAAELPFPSMQTPAAP